MAQNNTNPDLEKLKKSLKSFYDNSIIDNRNLFKYLDNITNYSLAANNNFNTYILKLFNFNVNTRNLLTMRSSTTNSIVSYTDIPNNLLEICSNLALIFDTLFELSNDTTVNFIDNYKKLTDITIVYTPTTPLVKYIYSSGNTLTININGYDIGNAPKIYNIKTTVYNPTPADSLTSLDYKTILSNHMHFIFHMIDSNIKIQTFGISTYYCTVMSYYNVYNISEKFLLNNTGNFCNTLFPNIFNVLLPALKRTIVYSQVDSLTKNLNLTFTIDPGNIKGTKFIINFVESGAPNINRPFFASEHVFVTSDGKRFAIDSITSADPTTSGSKKYINSVTLKKIATVKNYNNLPLTDASIIVKNLTDFKNEFVSSGIVLKKYDKNISDSSNIINNSSRIYKKNLVKYDIVKIQYNIYCCIMGIISFLLIALSVYNFDFKTKQMCMIGIIVLIIILILINYYIQHKYIEEFTAGLTAGAYTCNAAGPVIEKSNYVQNIINLFVPETIQFLDNIVIFLPTLDTVDLYKNITNSISKEESKYNNLSKSYKNKEVSSAQNTQLLYEYVLNKSSDIFLLSYIYLLIVITLLLSIMFSNYIKIILFIALIFFIIIIWIYVYNIAGIVRTESSNKYWEQPTIDVITKLNRTI